MANGTWKIARGRGSSQLSLAVFVVFALIVVLLGRAQPALFNHARAYFSDWTSPALETARVPVQAVGNWVGNIGDFFRVYRENILLKQENARLRQWQNAALVLEQRLKRYQLLLNAVPDPEVDGMTAHVIGRENRPFLNTIILNSGRKQGAKPGEAVVDERGMIGRVFLVGDHTAWVILLTDLNSHIPVTIEPGNMQAMLSGDNTSSPVVDVSAQGAQLKEGQQIVTSGDGGLLPAGLPIGMVWQDGQTFRAALLADAATSDEVRILNLKLAPEESAAPGPNDLPIAAAGLPPMAPPPPKPASSPPTQVGAVAVPAPVRPTVTRQAAKPPSASPTAPGTQQDEPSGEQDR